MVSPSFFLAGVVAAHRHRVPSLINGDLQGLIIGLERQRHKHRALVAGITRNLLPRRIGALAVVHNASQFIRYTAEHNARHPLAVEQPVIGRDAGRPEVSSRVLPVLRSNT